MVFKMQWLVNGCYAGSVVLYLVVKYYYENEARCRAASDDDHHCRCCREQRSTKEVAAAAERRELLHEQGRGPSPDVPRRQILHQVQRHVRESFWRPYGQR